MAPAMPVFAGKAGSYKGHASIKFYRQKKGPEGPLICYPPRYASRTFGSVSSASPVPCITTLPFSST